MWRLGGKIISTLGNIKAQSPTLGRTSVWACVFGPSGAADGHRLLQQAGFRPLHVPTVQAGRRARYQLGINLTAADTCIAFDPQLESPEKLTGNTGRPTSKRAKQTPLLTSLFTL